MRKNARARLQLADDGARLAARAWRKQVYGLAREPVRWFDLVEQFVEEDRPANPERTAAVLLLALDNCRDWEDLVDGGWIFLITVHVYIHFEGAGVGGVRALGVADRFLRWLGRRGRLHEWDLACLRSRLDEQRKACGGKSRGVPRAYDVPKSGRNDAAHLVERFAREAEIQVGPAVAESMVVLLGAATRFRGTDVVRFGALDPFELWELLRRGDLSAGSPREREAFFRDLCRVGAAWFGWLADGEHLEPGRARELQRELVALAASGPAARA